VSEGGGPARGPQPDQRHGERTPVDLVLSRLQRVRRSGRGWTACCPAHNDKTPSLSIAEGDDGRLLLHCFGGCEAATIVAAIGLELADLFAEDEDRDRSFYPGLRPDIRARGIIDLGRQIDRLQPVTVISAATLEHMELPEPRYAVPGILVSGLAMLAAKPKIGKSWMALDWAIAVASGGTALGVIDIPEAGDALYMALEDSRKRIQTRIWRLMGDGFPPRLGFAWQWPKMDDGGIAKLEGWLQAHREARLVVIDVWKRVRQTRKRGADPYGEDYEHMVELKTLADRYNVTVLVIHHTRKAEAADVLDEVSGTGGIAGALDSVLVLHRSRSSADAELWITGRDIEEGHKALRFDKGIWTLLGESSEVSRSSQRQAILATVNAVNGGLTPAETADALGKPRGAIKSLMWKMLLAGELERGSNTKYIAALTVSSVSSVTGVDPLTMASEDNGQRGQRVNTSSNNPLSELRCPECGLTGWMRRSAGGYLCKPCGTLSPVDVLSS